LFNPFHDNLLFALIAWSEWISSWKWNNILANYSQNSDHSIAKFHRKIQTQWPCECYSLSTHEQTQTPSANILIAASVCM